MKKLEDVARLAGVSPATASRALSRPELVREATLARIRAAVDELGYVPHGAARALASNRTRTVGAIVPTLDNAIFANSTHALQQRLYESGYTLVIASHEYDLTAELDIARSLVARGIDGLALVGVDHDARLLPLLDARAIPYVLTWALDRSGRRPCIGFDNRAAAAQLAGYLADTGHRVFAMISGIVRHNDRARERMEGVQQTLAARGIALPATRVVERPFTLAAGREGLRAVLAAVPMPTAVICGNDVLALGALAEARTMGIDVPRQLSITGFDDMEMASLNAPRLTTMHFPKAEIGALAAAWLLDRIAGRPVAPRQELPFEMMIRGTTAPPPSGNP
jgi:LacI family transcriptional regulator